MAEDYNSRDRDYNHSREHDVIRDAHTNAHVAKLLATLAIIASVIALAVALSALNKANDALHLANRNLDPISSLKVQSANQ